MGKLKRRVKCAFMYVLFKGTKGKRLKITNIAHNRSIEVLFSCLKEDVTARSFGPSSGLEEPPKRRGLLYYTKSDRVNSPNDFNPLHLYGLVKRCPFAYILVERPTMEYIFLVSSESIIRFSMHFCPCPVPVPSLPDSSLYCTICFLLVTVAAGRC